MRAFLTRGESFASGVGVHFIFEETQWDVAIGVAPMRPVAVHPPAWTGTAASPWGDARRQARQARLQPLPDTPSPIHPEIEVHPGRKTGLQPEGTQGTIRDKKAVAKSGEMPHHGVH